MDMQALDDIDDIDEIDELEELEAMQELEHQRWFLQDRMDPFKVYPDQEFMQRYRLTKEVVHFLAQRLEPRIIRVQNIRGTDVPVHLKVLCALRYMACGSFQIAMGDCSDLSQSCVSRCISSVCTELASMAHEYIKFSSIEEQELMKERFAALAPMPGVIGCIDCTHIPIVSPGGDTVEQYRNRKGFLSINVQAVCDAELKFTNVVSSWPGSAHDSRIFRNSAVCHLLERQQQENRLSFLLGDAGYPCLPYLLTPLPNPTTEKEQRFNRAHIKIRNSVERSFGVLKRRFACLSIPLRTKLESSKRIILSCAVLHNIAITRRIPLPLGMDDQCVNPNQNNVDNVAPAAAPGPGFDAARGFAVRAHVVENYF